ncbi:MAG TPA: hypothetical protein VHF89_15800 [Solirubrobacteraceae bacterium]|nr:hypothetical protein [Solirubrobacteraceae bacterium]
MPVRRLSLILLAAAVVGWAPEADAAEDRIVTGRPSPAGFQLFTAVAEERWAWRPLATIQPGGSSEDDWIGYHCTTGDGRHVVAVVAPRRFANRPLLRDRGAFAYAIEVRTGDVRPLIGGVALKYHTPGCGRGGRAALIRHLGTDQAATEVLVVDPSRARIVRRLRSRGQLTSALPAGRAVLAAKGRRLVRVARRRERTVARLPATPYSIRTARGGTDMLVPRPGGRVELWRAAGGTPRRLAAGRLGVMRLFAGAGSRNVVVGADRVVAGAGLRRAAAPRTGVARAASTRGGSVLADAPRGTQVPHGRGHDQVPRPAVPTPAPILVDARDGEALRRVVPRGAAEAYEREPPLLPLSGRGPAVARAAANTTTPKCAVPRNHLRRQVPQPNAAQVDWAIQQATRNALKGNVLTRPSNYANMQLASYQPSVDFARGELRGAPGIPVPPSVIQAVFAQESAWLHASRRALPGVSGNPSVSDYYGAAGTLDRIDYDRADCGYGVSQVTDYMTASSTALSANGKTKVAVDYAENVAVGITFLVNKWNQLHDAGITLNNANPEYLENWYFAVWAYNSGFHPNDGTGGPWGLGWTNNPQNADYPPDRQGFLRATYADAEHPADWPYQERVIGWMETPLLDYRGNASYARPLNDPGVPTRVRAPGYSLFCTSANSCSPSYRWPGDPTKDYCMRADRKCWWHSPVTYVDCAVGCAHSQFTVPLTAGEPAGDGNYPPACASTLEADAIIVDDQSSDLNVEGCGTSNWTSRGDFSFRYGRDAAGVELGQIDWHQLGTGFGGHVWFTKNQRATDAAHVNTGTWTPPALNGVYNIKAHVPPSGASTSYARYVIHRGDGTTSERVVDQHHHENRWISLGNFTLQPGAKVVLDNVTPEGDETTNVAFDAVAFTEVQGERVRRVFDATTTFDDNQNLDTESLPGTGWLTEPFNTMENIFEWADDLSRQVTSYPPCVAGQVSSACVGAATYAATQRWRVRVLAAGSEHREPPPPDTQPRWLGFASPDPPQPLTSGFLSDADHYKIRARMEVEYLVSGGRIDPSSVTVLFDARAGDTRLPQFVVDVMHAIRDDYGVALPDTRYSAVDLRRYSHAYTAANPAVDGVLPGRSYRWKTSEPEMTDGGACVRVKSISGGTIGFRPMLKNAAVRAAVAAWKERVQDVVEAGRAPAAVMYEANGIWNQFFSNVSIVETDLNSPFHFAPAIWIQQDARFCADGSVKPGKAQIADSGYMPDLYLYLDEQPVDLFGRPAVGPAQKGDFVRFANPPHYLNPQNDRNPWNDCHTDPAYPTFLSRRDGMPWELEFDTAEDQSPTEVRFCDGLPPGIPAPHDG